MNADVFSDITETERAWIEAQTALGYQLVSEYSPSDAHNQLCPQALDRAWTSWLAKDIDDAECINQVINGIGTCFGILLVNTGVFEWTIATDDFGTDLAVRALPERGDVVVFPANFVSKRWERKESAFLADGYRSILKYVENLKKEWDESGK